MKCVRIPFAAAFPALVLFGAGSLRAQEQPVVADDVRPPDRAEPVKALATPMAPGWSLGVAGEVTAGIGIRTGAQKASLKPGGSDNMDDGDLNYAKDATFSRVLQGDASLDLRHSSGYGLRMSAMAWTDDALEHDAVPHGNSVDGYVPGDLSDRGFARQARFTGWDVLDTYLYGRSDPGLGAVDWQVGRVRLPHDPGFTFSGGLRDLDARNIPAAVRPGSQAAETILPFWGATAHWGVSPVLRLDGFVQFAQRRTVEAGCGTLFEAEDYTANGCNLISYNKSLTEQQDIAHGVFISRAADIAPGSHPDQFGLGANYLVRDIGTRFGIYAAHYDSRTGYTDSIKGATLGPSGLYAQEYPGDKTLVDLKTSTRVPSLGLAWLNELAVIDGQPVQKNPSSLLAAFLQGQGPYGPDAIAQAPHSTYQGWDRFRVEQLQTGLRAESGPAFGARRSTFGVEAGLKHVEGLPSRATRPYGRPETDGACSTTAQCATLDGFVTSTAWAYRLHAGMEFGDVAGSGFALKPTLTFAQDVRGWSYDYQFIQGRRSVRATLDAEFPHGVFANVTYVNGWGGQFNSKADIDYLLASIGVRF